MHVRVAAAASSDHAAFPTAAGMATEQLPSLPSRSLQEPESLSPQVRFDLISRFPFSCLFNLRELKGQFGSKEYCN